MKFLAEETEHLDVLTEMLVMVQEHVHEYTCSLVKRKEAVV